ncbi:RNA polymerase sigma factor RpoD/SigA [Pedobacter aquatilis]|uniref:sigma-70 family RNA polymerase sigma factor n=1 Tax=Pedobacter aquatilis TaxID=351343 RepID=UPI00292CBDB6|nr:RNA polymerase sigma factor RpoD/SigA [Pedobacter aquatilis]
MRLRALKIEASYTNRDADSLNKYLCELGREEVLSAEEEVRLARAIKKGDKAALDKLVRSNLRFVASVAKKYQNMGLPFSDIIAEGNIGLIKAAKTFDETKGFKFISFAVWWIWQSILTALGEHMRPIRLPMNQIGNIREMRKSIARLEQSLERAPTLEEIAKDTKLTVKVVREQLSLDPPLAQLDKLVGKDENDCLWATCEDKQTEKPDEALKAEDRAFILSRLLAKLSPREQQIVKSLYGLNSPHEESPEVLSSRLSISRDRVRQISFEAIKKMRSIANPDFVEYV